MLDLILANLRSKLLFLFGAVLLLISLSVWYGLSSMSNIVGQYSHIVKNNVQYSTDTSAINVSFKIQVQEWKNTLIRGKDEAQRKKYWSRFNKRADDITKSYQSLLNQIDSSHPAYRDLSDFSKSYPAMIAAYRNGYKAFVESGYDVAVGDQAVSGIDREPSKKLTSAVEAMVKDIRQIDLTLEDSSANTYVFITLILFITFIAGFVVFYWFTSAHILTPLNEVTEVSRLIAEGDFTRNITIKSNDQIGQLATNFSLIQNDLSKMVGDITADVVNLRTLTTQLFEVFSHLKSGLDNQFEVTQSVSSNMLDMSQIGETIEASASQANEFAKNSTDNSTQGLELFASNVQTSQSMLQATNDASDIILSLKEDSDNIGSVISVINGVAEQTNLLALNAAIEAARAGESGRGFAVVADEVRGLATKTQESTQQISENISKLQLAADQAVSAMEQGKEQAALSVEKIKSSQQFMQDLTMVFEEITKLNGQIEQAVSSQNLQSNLVNQGLDNISTIGNDSQSELIEMEQASSQVSEVLQKITQSTNRFKLKN